ncbi:MAG: PAS domain-containing protein [Deltaproteobacteria bacterium]|nr:PAS domain-containing protein [Deltaproteobacteria bacterium]
MPLRRKLLLAMLIPAILLGVVGTIGVYSLRHLEQAAGRILADNYRSIQEARRMERALHDLEFRLGSGAVGGQMVSSFDEALDRCESNITERGETAVLGRIRAEWSLLRPAFGDAAAGQREQGPAAEKLYQDLEELISLNEHAMIEYERETRRVARVMLGAVAGSVLAAVVALAFFALISAGRISRPVTQVADRLHIALKPADGADRAEGRRNLDEIERLRQELDALLERLSRYEDEQDRKLSHLQGRLAFVMNEVLEGLILLDAEHGVMAMNRVARKLLGPGCVEGARLDALDLCEDLRRVLEPLLSGAVLAERDLGELRHELDGRERVYRPRVLTLSTGDGSVEGYLLLFWDVTEQHRFEESRRRFISMLSHQLKTPMTSLTMSVNLLQEKLKDVPHAHAELLSIATENCNSLSALVSDLIEAARDVTPDLTLKPRRVDIVRLLRSALRPLAPQAEDRGIELVMPSEDEPILISVDPVKFPWVVTNITGNALRYTGRGGRIEVAVARAEDRIEVSVEDTGAGIPAEHIELIFQPYVSLDEEPQPGTHGLGLAIAREIVEAHGGSIEARSEPGIGTRFAIRLPS